MASDCTREVGDDVAGTKEVARIVESSIVEKVAMIEEDVGTALVETTAPEDVIRTVEKTLAVDDGTGTALEEGLSALMMSAAFTKN